MPRARVKKETDVAVSPTAPISPPVVAVASHIAPSAAPTAPKSRARLKADAKQATDHHLEVFEWIDQHLIEAISLIPFHQRVIAELTHPDKGGVFSLPNVLFYGSVGFPLEYMGYALVSSGAKKRECLWENKVPYCECEAFFEVQCRHPELSKDYGVLCEFLKAILHTRPIHRSKHVFILRDIDIIARTEHHYALRVLLERHSNNVLFIATTHVVSAIEAPLRSRFMMIRVPQPTPEDAVRLTAHFGAGAEAAPPTAPKRKTLMELLYTLRAPPPEDLTPWRAFLSQSPPPSIQDIRFYAYRCFQKGMSFAYFCAALIQHAPTTKHQTRLVKELADLEHRVGQSSKGREPIYYERALYLTLFANSLWK